MRAAALASLLLLPVGLAASPIAVRADAGEDELLGAPWADDAPRIDEARRTVRTAAVGLPDERLGRLAARRVDARRHGEARALRALHAWADDALAAASASATVAAQVHAALDAAATVRRVRALSDGSAVVELEVPLDVLRRASGPGDLPWNR